MVCIINKNILEVTEGLILHGVNCQRAMGSGLAKLIKNKYPIVYEVYMDTEPNLGTFVPVQVTDTLWIGNCYTQRIYGRDPLMRYVNYIALDVSLRSAVEFAEIKNLSIHSPIIGSGLGNGDRKRLLEIYEYYPSITLYEYPVPIR